jgi:hypothetical protein
LATRQTRREYEHFNDLGLKDPHANEKPVNLTHGKLDIATQEFQFVTVTLIILCFTMLRVYAKIKYCNGMKINY